MSDLFLTKPKKPNTKIKPQKTSFDFNEKVVNCLIDKGVPFRVAEVAVIDMKGDIFKLYKENKMKPEQVASNIISTVCKRYTYDNKKWHYS